MNLKIKKDTMQNIFLKHLLNLIIMCAIFGFQFKWHGREILVYRILVFFSFLLFLLNIKRIFKKRNKYIEVLGNKYIQFYLFWMGYALISLLWVQDYSLAIKNIYYLFIGIFFIIVMQFIPKNLVEKNNYIRILSICAIALIIFGMYEHITGYHLQNSNYYASQNPQNKFRPTGVFNNTNDYALFLSMFLWFVYYNFLLSKKKPQTLVYLIIFFCGSYLLLTTSSRAGIIAYGVQLGALFLLNLLGGIKKKLNINSVGKLGLIGVYILIFLFMNHLSDYGLHYDRITRINTWSSSRSEESTQSIRKETSEGSSVNIRMNLIKNSLLALKESKFIGVGAGNVEWYMKNYGEVYYPTRGILNVHNWWVEVLVNYGVIVFVLYTLVLLSMGIKLVEIYLKSLKEENIYKAYLSKIFIVILVGFPLASISPSSIMNKRFVWIVFASIIFFIENNKIFKT